MQIKMGSVSFDAAGYASQGNAILGIRDSGKSYAATFIAERLMDAGVPITVFDPIGVWRFLRVADRGSGYPVVVAGGDHGDLPLTPQSAPEIVRAAMREGVSLVLDLYSMQLSKADWRRIVEASVKVLLYENKTRGLRHIFIEEAAEFAPQQIRPDQGAVYDMIERLSRMGGNALLGYTLINQRAEQVNKAILELCDSLFLFRQKGKNSLTSLAKWLSIAGAKGSEQIAPSLPLLAQGECWAWLSGSDTPNKIHVPQKRTFHPDRRTMHTDTEAVARKTVDVGTFVKSMAASLETLKAEAKANDPALLKRRIAELESAKKGAATAQAPGPSKADLREAEAKGFRAGFKKAVDTMAAKTDRQIDAIERSAQEVRSALALGAWPNDSTPVIAPWTAPPPATARTSKSNGPISAPADVTRPQQHLLDSLAMLESIGVPQPTRAQLALWAEVSPTSGGYFNNLGSLRTADLIDYPTRGVVALTDTGRSAARVADTMTIENMQDSLCPNVRDSKAKIVRALIDIYPKDIRRDELAEKIGVSATSGGYFNNLGALRTMGVVHYPASGRVAAQSVLFLE